MIELCNATESGMLKRGAYDFAIEDYNGFYFTYKMIEGGFVCGMLNEEDKEEIMRIWNSDIYYELTKLIIVSNNKKTGTLSFLKDGFYLQVPFDVRSLSLDREWSKNDLEDGEDYYYDKYEDTK